MPKHLVPLVSLAAFCDRVLQEKDETISLIRVIDRMTITTLEDSAPERTVSLPVQVNAVLGFKSGPVEGQRDISLRIKNPKGEIQETKPPFPVLFGGGAGGFNLAFTLGFEARQPGVHWVDVLVDDEAVTSMPLEIVYQPPQSSPVSTDPVPGVS